MRDAFVEGLSEPDILLVLAAHSGRHAPWWICILAVLLVIAVFAACAIAFAGRKGWASAGGDGAGEQLAAPSVDSKGGLAPEVHAAGQVAREEPTLIAAPWDTEAVVHILKKFGIDRGAWTPQHHQQLTSDLRDGGSRLRLLGEVAHREVDLVLLSVTDPQSGVVLQDMQSHIQERTPAIRLRRDEELVAAARRLLDKRVMSADLVTISPVVLSAWDTDEFNDNHPDLRTVVRKYLLKVEVATDDPNKRKILGLPSGSLVRPIKGGKSITYKWTPIQAAMGLLKHTKRKSCAVTLKMPRGAPMRVSAKRVLSGDPQAILPWSEQAVSSVCADHGIADVPKEFGISLAGLASKLADGDVAFGVLGAEKKLCLVKEIVSLSLVDEDGVDEDGCKVETDQVESEANSDPECDARDSASRVAAPRSHALPSWSVRLADESVYSATRRAAQKEHLTPDRFVVRRVSKHDVPPSDPWAVCASDVLLGPGGSEAHSARVLRYAVEMTD